MKKLLLFLGILVTACLIAACGGGKAEEKTEKELDWSVAHNDRDHQPFYMTLVQKGVEEYVAVAHWPWNPDSYHYADYDDSKSGCIVCTTEPLEIKNMSEKQEAMVIFSTDGEGYTIHSVAVGNEIYQDDGKLQNLLDKMNGN